MPEPGLSSEDLFNERRITAMARRCARLMQDGEIRMANKAWGAMIKAINQRSPAAVAHHDRHRERHPEKCRGFKS